MAAKKKPTLMRMIQNVILFVPNFLNVASTFADLLKIESRLIGRNIVDIIIFSIVFAFLLMSTWLCLLASLYFFLMSFNWSNVWAMLLIVFLNFLFLLIAGICLSRAKRRLLQITLQRKVR